MISPAWVQAMARYNAWQNSQLVDVIEVMDQADLDLDRGAFFGSVQGTLSHLLWGDQLWMSRFDPDCPAPTASSSETAELFPTKADWLRARAPLDVSIKRWAEGLTSSELARDFTWTYTYDAIEVTRPMGFVVTHFFNHQTHHRGQVHAMITAAGHHAPVSDLSYLPEDA